MQQLTLIASMVTLSKPNKVHVQFLLWGTGKYVRDAQRLEGKQPAVLYTLARDGALHSYTYTPGSREGIGVSAAVAEDVDTDEQTLATASQPAFTGDAQACRSSSTGAQYSLQA